MQYTTPRQTVGRCFLRAVPPSIPPVSLPMAPASSSLVEGRVASLLAAIVACCLPSRWQRAPLARWWRIAVAHARSGASIILVARDCDQIDGPNGWQTYVCPMLRLPFASRCCCQKQHWKQGHKKLCKKLAADRSSAGVQRQWEGIGCQQNDQRTQDVWYVPHFCCRGQELLL